MVKSKKSCFILFIFGVFIFSDIGFVSDHHKVNYDAFVTDTLALPKAQLLKSGPERITEFLPGDILVKANHNWLPGTAQVFGGKGFGHAALVIEGARDTDILRLLKKTIVFESHSRDVAPEYQLRKATAYLPGEDFRYAAVTFGPQNLGYCYRLRSGLSKKQIARLIDFVMAQDNGTSSWRAQKRFSENNVKETPKEGGSWYCSLLIWQAFYTLFSIDLDPNGGVMVYPNDLITGKYFDNTESQPYKRVRF